MQPSERGDPAFDSASYFAKSLEKSPLGPSLFVFDNFETVSNPAEVFRWLDAYVRVPNKVLITTRIRDFVGDYPIEVTGMTESEASTLIESVAAELGILSLLTDAYKAELFHESDGHPYVMKILLGEVAKSKKLSKPERIVASQDEILIALFERTFASLSAAAQRLFLLLASWRSVVPEVALEAVVLRSENERINVRRALDELRRASFVEELPSEDDDQIFVGVPLSATLFGRRKLTASPLRAVIDADTQLLQAFGAGRKEDVRHGVLPRIRRVLRKIAEGIARGEEDLDAAEPMLEFLASRVPSAWLDLAEFYEELGTDEATQRAKQYLRRYLERPTDREGISRVWKRLADLCKRTDDYAGEVHALVEMCEVENVPTDVISNAANRINGINLSLKRQGASVFDSDEKRTLIRRVARRMETRISELDSTDCSRLAWLHVNLGDTKRGLDVATRGLQLEPDNYHCQGLVARLNQQRQT